MRITTFCRFKMRLSVLFLVAVSMVTAGNCSPFLYVFIMHILFLVYRWMMLNLCLWLVQAASPSRVWCFPARQSTASLRWFLSSRWSWGLSPCVWTWPWRLRPPQGETSSCLPTGFQAMMHSTCGWKKTAGRRPLSTWDKWLLTQMWTWLWSQHMSMSLRWKQHL